MTDVNPCPFHDKEVPSTRWLVVTHRRRRHSVAVCDEHAKLDVFPGADGPLPIKARLALEDGPECSDP